MSSSPYELVRVEDPSTGHQFTTSRVHAQTSGLKVLTGKAATTDAGRPVRSRRRTNKAGKPAPRNKSNKE